jgi:hypothetical protein
VCSTLRGASADSSTRYGWLNLLDSRSSYGQFWFVEPLRAPEMDVDREVRMDYFHAEGPGGQSDEVKPEIEYNFGLLTLEAETSYQWNHELSADPLTGRLSHQTTRGFGGIELAARHPVFQYVSPDNFFDYTVAAAFEVAVPSGSRLGRDTELVPQLYQLARIGQHLSVEASVGYSLLIGPVEGGSNTLEYNLVLGCNLEHDELPVPGVLRTIPIFELNGDTGLSREAAGHNALSGTAGFRLNFSAIGPLQPRIGIGYVFPIDRGARDDLTWGIVTSVVFEF